MSLQLDIIYEDEVLLVCNKPAGLMVEPDRNNHSNLLQQVKNYLKINNNEKDVYVQHLHRLDRVTSGIVLFTKQKKYLRFISEQFAQRETEKHYFALTEIAPANTNGILENWHRKEKKKAVLVSERTEYAELAKLEYNVLPHGNNYLWEIKLYTGKYHQIRVQLANIGCPIIGDVMYGSEIPYLPNAIALHAHKLVITHPVTLNKITFESSLNFVNN